MVFDMAVDTLRNGRAPSEAGQGTLRPVRGFSGMTKRPKPRNERKASGRPAGIASARRKVAPDDAASTGPEGKREPDECDEIGPEGGYGGAGPDQDHPLR